MPFVRYRFWVILEILAPKITKRDFKGTSVCQKGIHVNKHPPKHGSSDSFEGSHDFLRCPVREIQILGNFRGFGANLGPKIGFPVIEKIGTKANFVSRGLS